MFVYGFRAALAEYRARFELLQRSQTDAVAASELGMRIIRDDGGFDYPLEDENGEVVTKKELFRRAISLNPSLAAPYNNLAYASDVGAVVRLTGPDGTPAHFTRRDLYLTA